jgi:hypothetical protein
MKNKKIHNVFKTRVLVFTTSLTNPLAFHCIPQSTLAFLINNTLKGVGKVL